MPPKKGPSSLEEAREEMLDGFNRDRRIFVFGMGSTFLVGTAAILWAARESVKRASAVISAAHDEQNQPDLILPKGLLELGECHERVISCADEKEVLAHELKVAKGETTPVAGPKEEPTPQELTPAQKEHTENHSDEEPCMEPEQARSRSRLGIMEAFGWLRRTP